MENINKSTCCLFKNNPNINPITKNPLTNEEKKEWMKMCKEYMSKIDDESIQNLKNTDIFSPRTNIFISSTEQPKSRKPSKQPIELSSSEEEVEIIEVSKPTYPAVELRKTIIPFPEVEKPSSSTSSLNDYFIKINSNLIFEDSILEKLRIIDLKDILKNEFINISAPNIIKSFNQLTKSNYTFNKILMNKENMIQFIKFLKDMEYKNNIKPNINDYIFNVITTTKINLSGDSEILVNQYLERKKKPVMLEKSKIPDEYADFSSDNIMNSFNLLKKRAEMVNSDNFLYELNINSINNELYIKKYNEQNFIFLFKLFLTDSSDKFLKPDNMPNMIYKLLYVNENIEDYKKIYSDVLKNKKLDLNNFIELYLNFLNYVKRNPFNKYIPPNLNKYIKKQNGATIGEPIITISSTSSKIKPRSTSVKEIGRPKSPEVEMIEGISKSKLTTNRPKSVEKYKKPEMQKSQKFFYPGKRSSLSTGTFTRLPEREEELYTPVSPRRLSPIEPYKPISPVYTPSSPPYRPVSPVYTPSSPPYRPVSPTYGNISPPYQPTNEPISLSPLEKQGFSKVVGLPPRKK